MAAVSFVFSASFGDFLKPAAPLDFPVYLGVRGGINAFHLPRRMLLACAFLTRGSLALSIFFLSRAESETAAVMEWRGVALLRKKNESEGTGKEGCRRCSRVVLLLRV